MPVDNQMTPYGYDFEENYDSARQMALELAKNPPYDALATYSEDDFKNSFLTVFRYYLENDKTFSAEEALVNEQALNLALISLLARYFRDNAIVTRNDLATFLDIIKRIKEIIETILNP